MLMPRRIKLYALTVVCSLLLCTGFNGDVYTGSACLIVGYLFVTEKGFKRSDQ